MSSTDVDDVEGALSAGDNEGESLEIKSWEDLEGILVDVLSVGVIDLFHDLPVFNDEQVCLTSVEAQLIGCILNESLDCLCLEPDRFLLRINGCDGAVTLLQLPSHAPGVLHSRTDVNIVT